MGNTQRQQRRAGMKRPGSSQRAQVLEEEPLLDDVVVRERVAERQRQCRAKKRSLEDASRLLSMIDEGALSRHVT